MQKSVDKIYCRLLGSCLQNKSHSHRIKLFCRFLNLDQESAPSHQDLDQYLQIVAHIHKSVVNFHIAETDDLPLIPSTRALELFKQTYSQKLSHTALTQALNFLQQHIQPVSQNRPLHLISATDGIPLDLYADLCISTNKKVIEQK